MNAAVARIILRYAAGALVAYGMIEADLGKTLAADKDVYGLLLVAVDFAVATLPGLVVPAWRKLTCNLRCQRNPRRLLEPFSHVFARAAALWNHSKNTTGQSPWPTEKPSPKESWQSGLERYGHNK